MSFPPLNPEYIFDLLSHFKVALSIEPTGELSFIAPDHVRNDVAMMLKAESFQKTLREYLGEWRPLAKCVECGVSITEQREDPACLEIRLASDAFTLDVQGQVVCGQCGQTQPSKDTSFGGTDELPSTTAARSSRSGHPAAVGSFPS